MKSKFRRIAICGAVTVMMTGLAANSWAQNAGYWPNMMGGNWPGMMGGTGGGYQQGMMNGYGAGYQSSDNGQSALADRFAILKQELKITSDQESAWKTYTDAATAADQTLLAAMRSATQTATATPMTPDRRFDLMNQMVALQKQTYDDQKKAADALLSKLTPYQSGQASMVLPGLAQNGGLFPGYGGYGMGPWMMGF